MKRSGFKRRPTGTIRRCKQCGDEFLATQECRSYRRRFCSPQCHGAYHHERTVASYPPKEEIERLYLTEGLSDRALGKHFGHSYQWAFSVRRHYGIPGRLKSAPRKPLERQRDRARWGMHLKPEDACRACGRTDRLLHLHHAIPRSTSKAAKYDLRNGLPLCTSCHNRWHLHRLVIYRDIFTPDEWAFVSSVELPGQRIEAWLDDHYPPRVGPDAPRLEHDNGYAPVGIGAYHAKPEARRRARELYADGEETVDIAREVGASRKAVKRWTADIMLESKPGVLVVEHEQAGEAGL